MTCEHLVDSGNLKRNVGRLPSKTLDEMSDHGHGGKKDVSVQDKDAVSKHDSRAAKGHETRASWILRRVCDQRG
jgi:hypothetical protein